MMRHYLMPSVAIVGIFVLSAHVTYAAATISDAHFQMCVTIPDGFTEAHEIVASGQAKYAFVRPSAKAGELPTIILFKGMGGAVGNETPKNVKGPDGTPATIHTVPWKSFYIYVARIPEVVEGLNALNIVAAIPIRTEAMTVTVVGDHSREAELNTLLTTILSTLNAPSNWQTGDERIQNISYNVGKVSAYLFVLWIVVTIILNSRKTRKEVVNKFDTAKRAVEDAPLE